MPAQSPPVVYPLNSLQFSAFNLKPAQQLAKWRVAKGKVNTNVSNARILCVGDSTTIGEWSTGLGGTNASPSNSVPLSWPSKLSDMFNTSGVNSVWNSALGNGQTSSGTNTPSIDYRISQGAGWTSSPAARSLGGEMWAATGATSNLSFTPLVETDTFNLFYPTFAFPGSFAYNLNGGGNTTVNQNTGVSTFATLSTTTTLGLNVCNINWVTGSCFFIAWEAFNSVQKCVSILNAGWGTSDTTTNFWTFNSAPFNPLPAIASINPNLTIICLGINDWDNSVGATNYFANMQLIINSAKTTGDVLLVSPVPTNPAFGGAASIAAQLTYINQLKNLCLINDLPMVNIYERWQSYAFSQPLGYYGDTFTHPIGAGYDDITQAIFNIIGNV